jgi:hypothetical protein
LLLELCQDLLYKYRISVTSLARKGLFNDLRGRPDWKSNAMRGKKWEKLGANGAIEIVLNSVQKKFCDNVDVEEGIAMNHALAENLFVTLVCVLNRIPIFLVGKPGSSKTLTLQVIASNLQGTASRNPYWRRFPAVYLYQYQVLPHTTNIPYIDAPAQYCCFA